jgi:hypothetical protein
VGIPRCNWGRSSCTWALSPELVVTYFLQNGNKIQTQIVQDHQNINELLSSTKKKKKKKKNRLCIDLDVYADHLHSNLKWVGARNCCVSAS